MTVLDFLSEIRETEQQAADLFIQARENAKLLQDDARRQAAEIVQGAREEAIVIQQQLMTDAETQAGQILLKAHQHALAEAAGNSETADSLLTSAARLVADRIVNENAHR